MRNERNSPMLRSGNRVPAFPVLLAALALFALTACNPGDKPKLPKPPFKTPVNLSREGVVADFDIRAPIHRIYRFEIHFEFPKEDQAERARVQKLVGGLHEPTPVPTPVKLTIFKKQAQGERVVYQKTIADPDTDSFSVDYFSKTIGHCNLPRGKYRFVLESLSQRREYASIPTKFVITFNGFPKATFIPINIDKSKSCPQ